MPLDHHAIHRAEVVGVDHERVPHGNLRQRNVGNPATPLPWVEVNGVPILGWLEFRNGAPPAAGVPGLAGFVAASSDALRSIEFVHNYAIPEDLGWEFVPSGIDVKIKVKSK